MAQFVGASASDAFVVSLRTGHTMFNTARTYLRPGHTMFNILIIK